MVRSKSFSFAVISLNHSNEFPAVHPESSLIFIPNPLQEVWLYNNRSLVIAPDGQINGNTAGSAVPVNIKQH